MDSFTIEHFSWIVSRLNVCLTYLWSLCQCWIQESEGRFVRWKSHQYQQVVSKLTWRWKNFGPGSSSSIQLEWQCTQQSVTWETDTRYWHISWLSRQSFHWKKRRINDSIRGLHLWGICIIWSTATSSLFLQIGISLPPGWNLSSSRLEYLFLSLPPNWSLRDKCKLQMCFSIKAQNLP